MTKVTKNLVKSLKIAKNEKDVENSYRSIFTHYFPSSINSPSKVDGLLEVLNENVGVLMEYKWERNFKSKLDIAQVLVQVLFYLKKLEKAGSILPPAIFVGDINECFCLATEELVKYLKKDINWDSPASRAFMDNPELVVELSNGEINPFVFNIGKDFNFENVIEKIKSICSGKEISIDISNENIVSIFLYFKDNVVTDKEIKENSKVSKLADVFFNCLTDKNDTYLHPTAKNVLVSRGERVKVSSGAYRSFFSHFKKDYSPIELEKLVSNKDRVIEEVYRRFTGAFFTPTIWVNEAHKMITEEFGENWKDEFVVWDCACGTANLTRDYKFKELYISTLEQGDINTIKDMGYNPGAVAFQYDFLNEVGIDGVPEGLKKAFEEGEKVLFLINPPYGDASDYKRDVKIINSKNGIGESAINLKMKEEKIGLASRNLYTQFMYKIMLLKENYGNIFLGIFSNPNFISGRGFLKFRNNFFNNFKFNIGMVFSAGEFSEVAGNWGISFTIWEEGKQADSKIKLNVKESSEINFSINKINEKFFGSVDYRSSDWVKEEVNGLKTFDAPQMTSAVNFKDDGSGKLVGSSLGYFYNKNNDVYHNGLDVSILSSCYSDGKGLSIVRERGHYLKCIALFTARKTIMPNWINCKDEYSAPNVDHPEYEQWNHDCVVYSLFNTSSQQSSLRNVEYKGKKWDIKNEFFFMSNEEMKSLANEHNFTEMYQDAKLFAKDSFTWDFLQTIILSEDAQEVLESARALVKKTMPMRSVWHQESPKNNLQTWDCSWTQLRFFMKKYYKADYDNFVVKYKSFENRMREGVYKFGFLER